MRSSDLIAAFLLDCLEKTDGLVELQRNELAQQFNVVPSQINYVISSRFTPEHGFQIESRRGGGGYIRIRRVKQTKSERVMHVINAVGKSLNAREAEIFLRNLDDSVNFSPALLRVMLAAVSDHSLASLPPAVRDIARADILKNMLISTLISAAET